MSENNPKHNALKHSTTIYTYVLQVLVKRFFFFLNNTLFEV